MKRIVILASGSGSNAEEIIHHFKDSNLASVVAILTNKHEAGVLERAARLHIPAFYFNRPAYREDSLLRLLQALEPDLIVLAGFLWKVPEAVVRAFEKRIVNIHPALLPKYGGKGMYGMYVHQAVRDAQEVETGITIHYVNEHYDEGDIIFQARTPVSKEDSAEQIAHKVHELEYAHFPKIIEALLHEQQL